MQEFKNNNSSTFGGSAFKVPNAPLSNKPKWMSGLHLESSKKVNWFFIVGIIILALTVLSWGGIFVYGININQQTDKIKQDIAGVQKDLDKHSYYSKKISAFADQVKSANALLDAHIYSSNMISLVEILTLKKIQWSKMDIDTSKRSIRLDGIAPSYPLYAEQIAVFNLSPDIASIKSDLPKMSANNTAGSISFNFSVDLVVSPALLKNDFYSLVKSLTINGVDWKVVSVDAEKSEISLVGSATTPEVANAQLESFKKSGNIISAVNQKMDTKNSQTTFDATLKVVPKDLKNNGIILAKSLVIDEFESPEFSFIYDATIKKFKVLFKGQTHQVFNVEADGKKYSFDPVKKQEAAFKKSSGIESVFVKPSSAQPEQSHLMVEMELILNPVMFSPNK